MKRLMVAAGLLLVTPWLSGLGRSVPAAKGKGTMDKRATKENARDGGPAPSGEAPGAGKASVCEALALALRDLDLRHFRGIPRDPPCPRAALLGSLGTPNPGEGRGSLGTEKRTLSYLTVPRSGGAEPLRLWGSEAAVQMADQEYPVLAGGLPALLAALGEPEQRHDTALGTVTVRSGEWIYARRGLTLLVNPANQRLLRVVVYPAMKLEEYERAWRLDLQVRRRPLGE